ncbi:ribosomal protein S18-alanine N-acetyltransferase [Enterococcus sp. 2201sp1_2201st1_B8_2201SCRN_220225]|uniref:ribosomal protein S18-alanine N-acetyltransferase n=1 Tax=unclassified Enterococcus TaxID=2608891 RepID=UPI0034A3FDCA
MKNKLKIRRYFKHEDPQVLFDLAKNAYGKSPWRFDQFAGDLRGERSLYFLAEIEDAVGFISCHQILDEVEITNLGVHPNWSRQGVAKALLATLFENVASNQELTKVFLEVRLSNEAAQKLYIASGFEVISRRKHYYENPPEDALIMCKIVPKLP